MGRVWLQPQKPTPDSDNTMSPSWQGPCHQAQVMLRQLFASYIQSLISQDTPPDPSMTLSLT